MKKIINRYRISKFKRFMSGLMFAIISMISLLLCLFDISQSSVSQENILLSFTIAIISMFLGLYTMFHNGEPRKENI